MTQSPIQTPPQLKILLQNSSFCIVDKPAGWLSVPSRMGAADPRPCVGIQLQNLIGSQVFPVHRLDEEVSGILLFALNEASHRIANLWFEHHHVQKIYQAICHFEEHTHFSDDRGFSPLLPQEIQLNHTYNWKSKILRGKRRAYFHGAGKPAETNATVRSLQKLDKQMVSRWELEPVTGRSHQLRIELARHGWPIDGDELYGSKNTFKNSGIALHAWKLDLSRVPEVERAELPEIFQHPNSLFI